MRKNSDKKYSRSNQQALIGEGRGHVGEMEESENGILDIDTGNFR